MTAPDLARFFAPRSIAVIGASPDKTKIRGRLLDVLKRNAYGGRLLPVNPSYAEIEELPCHRSIAAIGAPVDLALVAIPAEGVLASLEACAAAGTRFAMVITSGFAEQGAAGGDLQQAIAALARRTGMRVAGPNAEGFHTEVPRVAATFSPAVDAILPDAPPPASERRVGVVAQSGGIAFALYNRGRALGVSYSSVVSTGNEADLTASDFFLHMVRDEATHAVLLFLEGVRDAPGFIAAAAEAERRGKPVVAIKIGRTAVGERAAQSHTASMTGWNAAYDAVFRRYGIVQASDPDEAVAIAAAFATSPLPRGKRVAVVTASGGAGGWSAERIASEGLEVPELGAGLQAEIRSFIPDFGSARNPVDITAQAVQGGGIVRAIDCLMASPEVDIVAAALSLASDRRVVIEPEILKRLVTASPKPIVFHSYTLPSAAARRAFAEAGAVVHAGLAEFAAAIRGLAERGTHAPPAKAAAAPLPDAVAATLAGAGPVMPEHATKALLEQCGIALPPRRLVTRAEALDDAAAALGYPLALKIQSADIPHKTEAGGVRLGIADARALRQAYDAVLAEARRHRPDAALDGVLLEPMARRGVEVIVGVVRDAVWGPLVMVGAGGVTTELYKDVVYRLAPVGAAEAEAMLDELRMAPLLKGWRGAPPADRAALASLVARLSALAAQCERVAEVELNPVLVHEAGSGLTIVDALLATRRTTPAGGA